MEGRDEKTLANLDNVMHGNGNIKHEFYVCSYNFQHWNEKSLREKFFSFFFCGGTESEVCNRN